MACANVTTSEKCPESFWGGVWGGGSTSSAIEGRGADRRSSQNECRMGIFGRLTEVKYTYGSSFIPLPRHLDLAMQAIGIG